MVPERDRSYEYERATTFADPSLQRQVLITRSPRMDLFGDSLAGLRGSGNLTAALK